MQLKIIHIFHSLLEFFENHNDGKVHNVLKHKVHNVLKCKNQQIFYSLLTCNKNNISSYITELCIK